MNTSTLNTVKRFLGFARDGEPAAVRPSGFQNVEPSIAGPRIYQKPNAGEQFAVDVKQVRINQKPDGKIEFSLERPALWRIDNYLHKATIKFDRVGEAELLKAMVDSKNVQALLIGRSGSMEFKVRGVVDRTGERILDWEKHARGLTVPKAPDASTETSTIVAALRFAQQHDARFRQFAALNGLGSVDSGAQLDKLAEKVASRKAGTATHEEAPNPQRAEGVRARVRL